MKRSNRILLIVLAVLAATMVSLNVGMFLGITRTTHEAQQRTAAQLQIQPDEQQITPEKVTEEMQMQEEPAEEQIQPPEEKLPQKEEPPEKEVPSEEMPLPENATVQEVLDTFCRNTSGKWDICVMSATDGTVLGSVQAGEPMVSASVIKLFIMAAVYEQVELGNLTHDSVYTPIYHMITVSDNYSANQLVKLLGNGDASVGMAAVNAYAASIGCADSVQNRLMLEENGLQNYTTAYDCGKLLKMIYGGTCVSEVWSAEMLQILKEQTVCNRIPAGLPEGTVCANKTGDLAGLCSADVGIVFAPMGDYILCVICNDYRVDPASAMAELSSQIYGSLNP